MLPTHIVERPWSALKRLGSSPPDTLFLERGNRRGGTYMPASCAAKRVDVNYVGPIDLQDAYLGTVRGEAYSLHLDLQPWVRLCEPVDFTTNVRAHTTMLWRNTVTERVRHTARLEAAMRDDETREFFLNLQTRYFAAYKECYEHFFSEYGSMCDYSFDTFDAWVHEHEESSTGSKDEYGRTLTWGRLRAMTNSYQTMYQEVMDCVKAIVDGFEKAEHKVMSHDYAFMPDIAFAAGRNRPESTFQCKGHDKGTIVPGNHVYTSSRYRDRPAGGLRGFSWLGAFLHKSDAQKLERESIRRAWQAGEVSTPISGPVFDGLKSYVRVLNCDQKSYIDMANCEKFVGSQGFGLERLCFRGGRETSLYNALCEESGGFLTTVSNMIMNGVNIDAIFEIMGWGYEVEMHGDNVAIMGADDSAGQEIEDQFPHVYSHESVWLGHGQNRVVGIKATKDNKDLAISLTSDLRERPQTWHYAPDKDSEATAALLCRDIINRHFGGPRYVDFLEECAQRDLPPESMWGSWNGLADGASIIADKLREDGKEVRAFEESRSIVADNVRTLFE